MIVESRSPPVAVIVCQKTGAANYVIRDKSGARRADGNLIGMSVTD